MGGAYDKEVEIGHESWKAVQQRELGSGLL